MVSITCVLCVTVHARARHRLAGATSGGRGYLSQLTLLDARCSDVPRAAAIYYRLVIMKRSKPSGAQNRKRKKEEEDKKAKSKGMSVI